MPVPLLDLTRQHEALWPQMREIFERIVRGGKFVLGPELESFEQNLARVCATDQAVGLSSGTDALLAAMTALGPHEKISLSHILNFKSTVFDFL